MTTQSSSIVTAEVIPGPWPGNTSVSEFHSLDEASRKGCGSAAGPDKQRSQTYKHASAVHKVGKISCLTQGQTTYPSFVGFRNLMILVIRMLSLLFGTIDKN